MKMKIPVSIMLIDQASLSLAFPTRRSLLRDMNLQAILDIETGKDTWPTEKGVVNFCDCGRYKLSNERSLPLLAMVGRLDIDCIPKIPHELRDAEFITLQPIEKHDPIGIWPKDRSL